VGGCGRSVEDCGRMWNDVGGAWRWVEEGGITTKSTYHR
jgi:hypothetical protein